MTDQTKGTLRAFLNSEKVKGDSKPAFEGKLVLPGATVERPLALWVRQRKEDGAMMLTGRVEQPRGSALDQISGLAGSKVGALAVNDGKLSLKPGDVVLFENKAKEPNGPVDGPGAKPDFYGWHHSGAPGRGLVDLGVWAKTDTNGRAYLTGSIKDRVPDMQAQQDEDQRQDQDCEPEAAA
jgi:hypothetical protein